LSFWIAGRKYGLQAYCVEPKLRTSRLSLNGAEESSVHEVVLYTTKVRYQQGSALQLSHV